MLKFHRDRAAAKAATEAATETPEATKSKARGTSVAEHKIRKTGWFKELDDQQAHIAIGLRAAGWPMKKIAQALSRTPDTISSSLRRIPDVQDRIDAIRDKVRLEKMTVSYDVDRILWNRLKRETDTADAKDVDALFRSAYANEKIQANLVGAAVKVDVQHAGIQPNVELNQLLVQLGVDGLKELTGGA